MGKVPRGELEEDRVEDNQRGKNGEGGNGEGRGEGEAQRLKEKVPEEGEEMIWKHIPSPQVSSLSLPSYPWCPCSRIDGHFAARLPGWFDFGTLRLAHSESRDVVARELDLKALLLDQRYTQRLGAPIERPETPCRGGVGPPRNRFPLFGKHDNRCTTSIWIRCLSLSLTRDQTQRSSLGFFASFKFERGFFFRRKLRSISFRRSNLRSSGPTATR